MSDLEVKERLRQEQNIMDRIEGVKRLIQMETTLLTTQGARRFIGYSLTDREGKRIGSRNLLNEVREEIQLQLLSIVALCYGAHPDCGEPNAMLDWASDNVEGEHPADAFRDAFEKCLKWNA